MGQHSLIRGNDSLKKGSTKVGFAGGLTGVKHKIRNKIIAAGWGGPPNLPKAGQAPETQPEIMSKSNSTATLPVYRRLLSYAWVYKSKLLGGIGLAFLASIFNAFSITSFMPILDTISQDPQKPYQIPLTNRDRQIQEMVTNNEHIPWYHGWRVTWLEFKLSVNATLAPIPSQELIYYSAWVLPIFFLRLLCNLGTVFLIASVGLMATRDLRNQLFAKLEELPMQFFFKEKTGELMSRMINDANLVSDSISHDLRVTINNIFLVATHLMLLLFIHWKFVVLCLFVIPLVIWPTTKLSKRIRSASIGEQDRIAALNGHMQEVISGVRVTRAFAAEKYECERYAKVNHGLFRQALRGKIYHATGPAVVELTTSIVFIAMLIYGGYQVQHHQSFTIGTFFTFLFVFLFIMSPIKQLAHMINLMTRASAAGNRIFELIDYESDIVNPPEGKRLTEPVNSLRFRDISFVYPGTEKQVLEEMTFTLERGRHLALVGPSGAGKSTMVDLIPRFFDPNQGQVLINDQDIREMDLPWLRRQIGFVSQDVFLFNGTVRENICYSHPEIGDDQLRRVCDQAHADEFIRKLPQGYDTIIGEQGVMLSGGQRQRISIARALLKDPQILILDEATSALDTESEKVVQEALEILMRDRTTITIAHRLSTIFNADEILVIDGGRIVQRGNHRDLLAAGGLYKKLYDMQFSA